MALLTTSAHRKEEKKKKCIEVNPLREREREREGILWELHPTTTTRRWHTQCVSDAEPGQLNNTRPAALRVTTQHIQPDDVDAHSGWIINDIAVIYCSDTQLRLSIHFPKGVLCIELYTDNIYFDMMLVFMRDVQQKLKSPHHCIDLYFWPLVKVLASFFLLTGQFLPDFSCMDPYKNFPHARRTAQHSVCPAYVVSSGQEQQQQHAESMRIRWLMDSIGRLTNCVWQTALLDAVVLSSSPNKVGKRKTHRERKR